MLDRLGRDAIGRSATTTRRASIGRRPAIESLEGRQMLTASIAPIANISVPQYQGYQVPIEGGTTHQQTFTVTSDNLGVKASIARGRFLTVGVSHTASSTTGDVNVNGTMTFQLFDDFTPVTTAMITSLVNGTAKNLATGVTIGSDYYVGKVFHRIANNFPTPTTYIVQGGSLNGTGSGNVFATPYADEFTQSDAFTGSGQLALANSGADTNDAQFFITTGAPNFLSYHHTIFGQIVAGQNILTQLTQVAKKSDGTTPVNPVTITSASVSNVSPDGVIHLDTTLAPVNATANITVTATDVTDGTTAAQTFQANVAADDTTNGPLRPFLGAYDSALTIPHGQTTQFQIMAVSPTPNDPLTYTVQGGVTTSSTGTTSFAAVDTTKLTVTTNASTGLVSIKPVATFTGSTEILIGVRDSTDRSGTGTLDIPANYEYHYINVTVPASTTAVNQRPLTTQRQVMANTLATTPIQLTGSNPNATTTLPLTYAITTQPTHGTVALNTTTGLAQYTPTPGYLGPDALAYTATDPNSGLASFGTSINIAVANANTGAVRFIPNSSNDTVGTLVVTPVPRTDSGTNVIRASVVNGTVQVTVNGVLDQTQPTTDNVDRIVIYGSKANDNITIDPSLSAIATIDGGHGGKNILTAGSGQTREHGWFGRNTLVQGSSDNYQLGRVNIGDKFVKGTGNTNVIFLGRPGHFTRHLQRNRELPTPTSGRFYKFAANGKTLVVASNPYKSLAASKASSANPTGVTGSTSTTRTSTVTAAALAAAAAAADSGATTTKTTPAAGTTGKA